MALLRAKIDIPRDTALPEDTTNNTLHFSTTEIAPYTSTISGVAAALNAMYQVFDQYLSPVLSSPGLIKFYDLGDPAPRVPISSPALTLTLSAAADALPEECAVVLSFSAAAVSGVARARRRGRIYVGPLTQAVTTIAGGRVRVLGSVGLAIVQGAQGLLAASIASGVWNWVVYSPTSAAEGGTQDDWYAPVVSGWVDDAFDTQRRRGPRATTRQIF